ncbi:MAG: Rrf2 family transcriptional regulator [Lachnospiraceae bacterium]|nr:Rrf2 family transcriptional regulator [Lachnospiraceae bacterium]
MKYSTKLSDAVHILSYIQINPSSDLSSTAIAKSVQTNPGFVRQIMMCLRKAGLIQSVTGHAKPTLTKSADKITLLDIYHAVEGDKPLLHLDTHINPECGIGVNIQLALKEHYAVIQEAAEKEMNKITLENIINTYYQKVGSL